MITLKPRDRELFPFTDANMRGDLSLEYMRTSVYLNCMDGDDLMGDGVAFSSRARMFIVAHGSDEADLKGMLKGDSDAVIGAAGLAMAVHASGFVRGFENEIWIWSCKSGVDGGFAEQFAQALSALGATQLRVYGCLIKPCPATGEP